MSFWEQQITLNSGLSVPRFMAAPLDGVTDSPMRRLIRDFSPTELLFTEMRHVACVKHERGDKSLIFDPIERPLAFQFSANKTDFIEPAVEKVLAKGVDMINLNVGCPARAVIKSGSGSALMGDPDQLAAIIKEFMRVIDGRVSFTVKIRAGFKKKNAVEISKMCEGLGVDAIIIHPRTQTEAFAGLPDTKIVAEMKQAINIPIVFSGNLSSFRRVQKVYEQTGVDGFMIGRALWGCPWKMQQIVESSRGNSLDIDLATTLRYAVQHLKLDLEHYGPKGFNAFKKQLPVYIKGVENAASIRQKLLRLNSAEEIEAGLYDLIPHSPEAPPRTPSPALMT